MRIFHYFLLVLSLSLAQSKGWAQSVPSKVQKDSMMFSDFKFDSSRVKSYENLFGLDFFVQSKRIETQHHSTKGLPVLRYSPNAKVAIGLGFSYRYLVLNASFGVLPIYDAKKLKTRSFDFQSQIAGQRNFVQLSALFYKGFYTKDNRLRSASGEDYLRPDLGISLLGINNYFALNKTYSMRGSTMRFQRMKNSGGSILISSSLNFIIKSADSAFIPNQLATQFEDANIRRYRVWNVGLGGGYAYTWLASPSLLFSALATVNLPLNIIKKETDRSVSEDYLNTGLNASARLHASYDRKVWSITGDYLVNKMFVGRDLLSTNYSENFGLARLIFSRRLNVNRKARKALKPIDNILNTPKKMF